MESKRFLLVCLCFFLGVITKTHADSESFEFENPKLSGTGCPKGTGSLILTPDNESLSVLFDQFIAEVPNYNGQNDNQDESPFNRGLLLTRNNKLLDHKICILTITATIPGGKQVRGLEVDVDFRGNTLLDPGIKAELAIYMVQGEGLGMNYRRIQEQIEKKIWGSRNDVVDEDWLLESTKEIEMNSNCSMRRYRKQQRKVTFALKMVMGAKIAPTFAANDPMGIVGMDSADVTGSLGIKLITRPCNHIVRPGNRMRIRSIQRGQQQLERRRALLCKRHPHLVICHKKTSPRPIHPRTRIIPGGNRPTISVNNGYGVNLNHSNQSRIRRLLR